MYKWFWEVKHKQQDTGEADTISKHISELSDEQKLEVFVNKALKQYREQMTVSGKDGSGRKLTEEEIMSSIKLHCQAVKKEEDYEVLAK